MSKDKNKNGKRKKKKKGRSTMKPMVTTNELYCNVVKDVKDVKSTEVEMVVAGKVKESGKFKGEEKKGKGNEEEKVNRSYIMIQPLGIIISLTHWEIRNGANK